MSRKAPAVQVYAEDFLGGTKFMTNAEVGLYIRLLLEQVDKGFLPDDVEHFVKAYKPECRKLWPAVRAKFVAGPEPGTMINERMAEAIAARDAFRSKQSKKGKLSAAARSTKVKPRKRHGSTVVEPLGDGVGDNTLSGKEPACATFEQAFAAYGRHGGKMPSEKAWGKLSVPDRNACFAAIPAYVKGTHTDGTFPSRKHFSTYLNQRSWEDLVFPVVVAAAKPMTKAEAYEALKEIRKANGIPEGGNVGPELMTPEIRALIFQ